MTLFPKIIIHTQKKPLAQHLQQVQRKRILILFDPSSDLQKNKNEETKRTTATNDKKSREERFFFWQKLHDWSLEQTSICSAWFNPCGEGNFPRVFSYWHLMKKNRETASKKNNK